MSVGLAAAEASRLTKSPATHWSRYPSLICDGNGDYCLAWYRYPPPASRLPCQIFFCKDGEDLGSISRLEPVQVTDDGRNHTGAVLCEGAGAYWLAWHCWPQAESPHSLLFSMSRDGKSWSDPFEPLAQIEQYMIHPSLVWDRARGFQLAFTAALGPASRIALSCSADGVNWEAPRNLPVGRAGDDKATLAIDLEGRVLLAWRCTTEDGHGIRWSTSADGERWELARDVDTCVHEAQRPKLSIDNAGRTWLAYEGDGAIRVCYLDKAQQWSRPFVVSKGPFVESRPSALVQNRRGDYWLAWTSERAGTELWASRITLL